MIADFPGRSDGRGMYMMKPIPMACSSRSHAAQSTYGFLHAAAQAAQCKEARALALGSSAVSVPLLSPDYSRSMGDHGLILWLSKP